MKSENGYGLAGYEFLSVPHTNYVSISHRLVTVHKRDTRRRTTTDDDDAQTNFLWHRANFISFVRPKTFRGRTSGPRIPGQGPPGKWWRRWKRGVTGKMQGKAEWEAMDGGQLLGYWNAPKRRSVSSLPITIAVCFTRYQCGCGGYALPMSPGKCVKTKL